MIIPTKLSEREKKILFVVVALLIVLVGYHGIWRPMNGKFAQMEDEITAMEMRLRKAKTFIRQKDEIMEISKNYTNLEKMDAGSDEEEIARLLNFIEQAARKNNVSLSDVKPEPFQSDKVTKRYKVRLDAEAQLDSMVQFMYELTFSDQDLKIERAEMAPKEEGSAVLRASYTITRIVVK